MRRVWISFLYATKRERDRENQPAGQVEPQQQEEHAGNHFLIGRCSLPFLTAFRQIHRFCKIESSEA